MLPVHSIRKPLESLRVERRRHLLIPLLVRMQIIPRIILIRQLTRGSVMVKRCYCTSLVKLYEL